MDIATAVRRARTQAGLSQRALATRTGIAQPTIARIELGLAEPRVSTLQTLLAACGHRLDVDPIGGVGVDRTAIRELLGLTPAQRAQLAVAEAHNLETVPVGALRGRRRSTTAR